MTIQDWFDKYGESHQNPFNKAIHWICIPSIFFSLIGLLSLIPLNLGSEMVPAHLEEQMHLGSLFILFGLVFYIRLSVPIALGMILVSILILRGVTGLHRMDVDVLTVNLIIFLVAWAGQFIGHNIEGTKPSFLDDVKFLLIGPAWLLGFIYKKLRIKY